MDPRTPAHDIAAPRSTPSLLELEQQLERRRLLTKDETIAEIRGETDAVGPGLLDARERLQLRLFRVAYAAATKLRRRPFVSTMLHRGGAEVTRLQKRSMDTYGPTRDQGGGHHLGADELRFFQNNGLVGPYPVELTPDRLTDLRDRCLRAPMVFPHMLDRELLALALDPRITQRVASILGPSVDIVRSSVFVKAARAGSQHSHWHMAPSSNYGAQEQANMTDFVTVWVALTPAQLEHGCLKMIPGSFAIYPNNLLTRVAELECYLDDPFDAFLAAHIKRKIRSKNEGTSHARSAFSRFISDRVNGSVIIQKLLATNGFLYDSIAAGAVHLAADPGDFYIFTSENYHASLPNISDTTRVAFAIRYGRAEATMDSTKNVATLIDTLPERLRGPLRLPGGGYRAPVVRALGPAITGPDGNRFFFDAASL